MYVQAWSQFSSQLEDLALPEHRRAAIHCLNLLITNALQHVPDVICYMSRIRNQSVFNFCAIPQVCMYISACEGQLKCMHIDNENILLSLCSFVRLKGFACIVDGEFTSKYWKYNTILFDGTMSLLASSLGSPLMGIR